MLPERSLKMILLSGKKSNPQITSLFSIRTSKPTSTLCCSSWITGFSESPMSLPQDGKMNKSIKRKITCKFIYKEYLRIWQTSCPPLLNFRRMKVIRVKILANSWAETALQQTSVSMLRTVFQRHDSVPHRPVYDLMHLIWRHPFALMPSCISLPPYVINDCLKDHLDYDGIKWFIRFRLIAFNVIVQSGFVLRPKKPRTSPSQTAKE